MPFLFILEMIEALHDSSSVKEGLSEAADAIGNLVARPLYGVALLVRGLTQLAATPLMLAKKMLRNVISYFVAGPKIEDMLSDVVSNAKQQVSKNGEEKVRNSYDTTFDLSIEFSTLKHNGVATDIDLVKEKNYFNNLEQHYSWARDHSKFSFLLPSINRYLSLFDKKIRGNLR